MTQKQYVALDYLRLARASDPSTWDGAVTADPTYYDSEIEVAYVHWKTADALLRRGYIEYGTRDPVDGTEIHLVPNR